MGSLSKTFCILTAVIFIPYLTHAKKQWYLIEMKESKLPYKYSCSVKDSVVIVRYKNALEIMKVKECKTVSCIDNVLQTEHSKGYRMISKRCKGCLHQFLLSMVTRCVSDCTKHHMSDSTSKTCKHCALHNNISLGKCISPNYLPNKRGKQMLPRKVLIMKSLHLYCFHFTVVMISNFYNLIHSRFRGRYRKCRFDQML